MKNILDNSVIRADGHVKIIDVHTGEVLLDKHNAINFINMSEALAGAIANKTDENGQPYHIASIAYGNGGTTVDSTGNLTYNETNTFNTAGELYNQTYNQVIDGTIDNQIELSTSGEAFADLKITSTLDYDVPVGQNPIDDETDMEDDFVFDELGILLSTGKFISHLIFHPIEKSQNRKIQILYTVRISAGD